MHLPSQRPLPTRSSFTRDRCAPIVFSDSPPTSPCCQGLSRATGFSKTHQPETRKRQELLGAGEPSRTTHPATLQRSQLLLDPAPRPPPLPLCSPARHQILRFQEHRILAVLPLEMPEPLWNPTRFVRVCQDPPNKDPASGLCLSQGCSYNHPGVTWPARVLPAPSALGTEQPAAGEPRDSREGAKGATGVIPQERLRVCLGFGPITAAAAIRRSGAVPPQPGNYTGSGGGARARAGNACSSRGEREPAFQIALKSRDPLGSQITVCKFR